MLSSDIDSRRASGGEGRRCTRRARKKKEKEKKKKKNGENSVCTTTSFAMLGASFGGASRSSSLLLRAPMRGLAAAARRAPASGASSAPAPPAGKQFALRSPLLFWGLPAPEGELGVSASTATREELLTYLRQMYQVGLLPRVAASARARVRCFARSGLSQRQRIRAAWNACYAAVPRCPPRPGL